MEERELLDEGLGLASLTREVLSRLRCKQLTFESDGERLADLMAGEGFKG